MRQGYRPSAPVRSARSGRTGMRPGLTRLTAMRGHHPGRRLGHPAAPDHPGHQQAADAGLRQADDLLPAVDADPRRHPRHPRDHHPARRGAVPSGCSATARQFGISISYAVQPQPGRAGPGVHHRRATSSAATRSALVLGDNIFYGPGLGSQLQRFDDVDGGAVFALLGGRARRRTASSSSTTAGRAISLEEKPAQPQVATTRCRACTSTTTTWSRSPADLQAVGPRRVRDHRRQPALPRAAAGCRSSVLPRGHRLAGHRHLRLAQRRQQLRPHPRGPAGAQGRLPGGGRLAAGLPDRRRAGAAGPRPGQVRLRDVPARPGAPSAAALISVSARPTVLVSARRRNVPCPTWHAFGIQFSNRPRDPPGLNVRSTRCPFSQIPPTRSSSKATTR